jgi:hypothetical protein
MWFYIYLKFIVLDFLQQNVNPKSGAAKRLVLNPKWRPFKNEINIPSTLEPDRDLCLISPDNIFNKGNKIE